MSEVDVVIIGAGASGLTCAIQAGKRGRRVLVCDHAAKIGSKILISGGGKCNFTNLHAEPENYFSKNPHFCRSALSRYPARSFIERVKGHGIPFEERALGQLFCVRSAADIVGMLTAECDEAGVSFSLNTRIMKVHKSGDKFRVATSRGEFVCESLVVATGGLSLPKLGASGLGLELARKFGLKVTDTRPALDGFRVGDGVGSLAGIALECEVRCNAKSFRENVLFTHSGLSGPAVLQASLYWNPGDRIELDLLPDVDVVAYFLAKKKAGSRATVKGLLSELLPARLAELLCQAYFSSTLPLPQVSEKKLTDFCALLHAWRLKPEATIGYGKAEVMRGGIDTDELSSKTMEAKRVSGLYFIGEVVDVTGWLGGYNLQWAWSSGFAAGEAV